MTTSDNSSGQSRPKTAVVDGQEMDADRAASLRELQEAFGKLGKAIKQILLYRHNRDRYSDYIQDTYTALTDHLQRRGQITLRITATSYQCNGVEVYRDEGRENNLCYPFYAHGVRLLIINPGLGAEELLRFLNLVLGATDRNLRQSEDFVTRLWKAELQAIQYVVVEGFKAMEDEDAEQVQLEVDQVVAYLYKQLQSNTHDVARFARVDAADLDLRLQDVDQVRGNIISGLTATPADKDRVKRTLQDEETHRLLPKMVVILFQLLELATDDTNFEDVSEAFLQLLDAMLVAERFDVIQQIIERFENTFQKSLSPQRIKLARQAHERFVLKMGEAQRLSSLTQLFNAGPIKDQAGVKTYLMHLSSDALIPLLDALEGVEIANNRRMLADVIAELAKPYPERVANRLNHPSSNVVKDMLYILDKINPPNKLALTVSLLDHPNLVLRLETINALGRNPSEETLGHVLRVLKSNDPQMRTAAARVMHFFPPERAAPELLAQAALDEFPKRSRDEQRVFFTCMSLVNHPKTQKFVQDVFAQKASLFSRGKVDDQKLLMVEALGGNVAIPTLQYLAGLVGDGHQSKEVQEAARATALEMKDKLLGTRPAQG